MRPCCIGKDKSGLYYFFHHSNFGFATGYVFRPIFATEHYNLLKPILFSGSKHLDPESLYWDLTGKEYWETIRLTESLSEEEVPLFDCSRAGRVFGPRIWWEAVYEPDMLWQILEAEEDFTKS